MKLFYFSEVKVLIL